MTRDRRGPVLFWLAVLVGVVAVAWVTTDDATERPLDPRSVAPDGARGLVELAATFGADLEIGVALPNGGHDVAVVLDDRGGRATAEAIEDWVRRGGVLVVADPSSPLSPAAAATSQADVVGPDDAVRDRCAVPALDGVATLTGLGTVYRPPAGTTSCFGGRVVITTFGGGTIVAVGGPGPLLNARLDEADNAVLAVALLAPAPGTSVAFVEPRLGSVDEAETLGDLLGVTVEVLLVQLAVAFGVVALWKGRRFGRPVAEPGPVEIDGSELAAARGRLLAAIGSPDAAATALRTDARRRIARALSVPGAAPVEALASQIAAAGRIAVGEGSDVTGDRIDPSSPGSPPERLVDLLGRRPVTSDAELVDLAAALADLVAAAEAADPPRPVGTPTSTIERTVT